MNARAAKTVVPPLVAVAAVTFAYLRFTAVVHDRDLSPHIHDEHSYLIQAQMLARGRLWMPSLGELADSFESFHILVKPVYASIYFPGTALLFVPGTWLSVPPWVTALLICAGVAVALFVLTSQFLPTGYAWLAVLMLVGVPQFRLIATSPLSQQPAMLAGVLIVLLWIGWRKARSLGMAAALGAVLGWAAIVRPYDLLAYAIPVGSCFLFDLRGLSARRIAQTLAILVIAAAPFLSLQLMLNRATTGRWFTTPYRSYIDQFQPGSTLGFPPLTDARPQTTLQQKIDLYDEWARPALEEHRPGTIVSLFVHDRLPLIAPATVPSAWLLLALPFGFWAAVRGDRRMIVIAVVPFLFLLLYTLNPYFIGHYPTVIAPAVIVTALLGLRWVVSLARDATFARRAVPLVATAISIAALPEARLNFAPEQTETSIATQIAAINQNIREHVSAPAVVLFRYRSGPFYHVEPVYNLDSAWPLDAPIVRAHDLGDERNAPLVEYFAERQPSREFWLFDRGNFQLTRLGRADQLRTRSPSRDVPREK